MCCDFLYKYVWNVSHSKKNRVRYDQKCISVFMYSTRYSCQILMKLNFLNRFSKNTQIQSFMRNPSSGSRVFPCGQTDGKANRQADRYDEAYSRFSQFLRTRRETSTSCAYRVFMSFVWFFQKAAVIILHKTQQLFLCNGNTPYYLRVRNWMFLYNADFFSFQTL